MRFVVVLAVALLVPATAVAFDVPILGLQAVVVQDGFDFPVSVAFAPDGRMFVTEKAGRIMVVERGTPRVWATVDASTGGEQGLLGMAIHPNFATTPWVYVYYTDDANGTNRVVRFADAAGSGANMELVFDGIPRATFHNGGVLAFGRDGTLFVTTGDAGVPDSAQDPNAWSGKVLRLRDDGSVPADNPSPASPVYTLGHRNVFGLAVDPETGRAWITENGPTRHDEVNVLDPGRNYGWPAVTGFAGRAEFADPAFAFETPLPALTQATFLESSAYGEENRHALFFGGWNNGIVYRAVLSEDRRGVALVEAVHEQSGWGILDAETGPDGRLYVSAAARTGGGAVFALERLPPVGSSGEGHLVTVAAGAAVFVALFGAYLWRRRQLRRERS